jgi:hypothetical protein
MTDKETLKLALEALELMYACYAHPEWISHKQQEEKILAQCAATTMTLRQALAKQEQGEPVAWLMLNSRGDEISIPESNLRNKQDKNVQKLWANATPLYTTPQQRKPLTLVELAKIFASIPSIPFDGKWQLELVRAIEAAHGIKE